MRGEISDAAFPAGNERPALSIKGISDLTRGVVTFTSNLQDASREKHTVAGRNQEPVFFSIFSLMENK